MFPQGLSLRTIMRRHRGKPYRRTGATSGPNYEDRSPDSMSMSTAGIILGISDLEVEPVETVLPRFNGY